MRKITCVLGITAFFLLLLPACKKQSNGDNDQLLVSDPSVDNSYGQRINLNAWNGGSIAAWGRNSNELIGVTPQGILQINLSTATAEKLTNDIHGFIVQRDNDGNDIIFVGTVENEKGYYRLNLATRKVSRFLSLGTDQGSVINLYNNYLFVYIGTSVLAGRPCSGLWDFWCGTSWSLVDTRFYHVNTTTNATKPLDHVSFTHFSNDGAKALLLSDQSASNGYKYYFFTNNTQSITDSLVVPFTRGKRDFYWGSKLLYATRDFNTDRILIVDAFTNQETSRFSSPMNLVATDQFIWSKDGIKLFYGAACNGANCKYAINELDLTTGEERTLVSTASATFLANPFSSLLPSDDNRKLVFRVNDNWYLKSLQ